MLLLFKRFLRFYDILLRVVGLWFVLIAAPSSAFAQAQNPPAVLEAQFDDWTYRCVSAPSEEDAAAQSCELSQAILIEQGVSISINGSEDTTGRDLEITSADGKVHRLVGVQGPDGSTYYTFPGSSDVYAVSQYDPDSRMTIVVLPEELKEPEGFSVLDEDFQRPWNVWTPIETEQGPTFHSTPIETEQFDPIAGGGSQAVNDPNLTPNVVTSQGNGRSEPSPINGRNVNKVGGQYYVETPGGQIPLDRYDSATGMEKPAVSNPNLQNLVDKNYRTNGTVGSGSTADAVREEIRTGRPVGGVSGHTQKANEQIGKLKDWIRDNPNASAQDIRSAENMIIDMDDALATQ